LQNIEFINDLDYLIVVLLGHGANKNGTQIFQLQEDVFIQPGQLQFPCSKQLHIIETCRDIIDFELDIKRINRLIPKYKYGGIVKGPLTREESLIKFNEAIENSPDGVLYLFAASVGESARGYLFLQLLIDISVYVHEYFRNDIVNTDIIFENAKKQVIEITKGQQNPLKSGDISYPFVITII